MALLELEEVVVAYGNIEQVTRRNARRIVVVIFGSGPRYL